MARKPIGDKHAIPEGEAGSFADYPLENKKGKFIPGHQRAGRPKGSTNKTTTALKEAILLAGDAAHVGGLVGYLTSLAQTNSSAFAGLLGKVLPTTLVGDPANPLRLEIKRIERHVVDSKA